MALTRYKLGELISIVDERNNFGIKDFYGINIDKEFMPTWANTEGLDETKYKVVRKNRFVFSGMQTGRDECIRISMYTNDNPVLVSPAYTTFEITATDKVIPLYFFMKFLSHEKDRYGAFCSDGSIRSNLDWEVFCDCNIDLPPLSIQQKYVDVYNSMLANQQSYERGLEDLKLTCDATIEYFKRKYPCEKISKYIHEENLRNTNEVLKEVLGVCKDKVFIPTIANMEGISLENYKIVKPNWFAYSNRINIGSIAIKYDTPCLVSPSYTVFSVDETKMYPEYLSLWLQREEFCHFAFYYSLGTVKDELDMTELGQMNIPFPSLEIQNNIITIYKNYLERKELNEKLKSKIKSICPILIKGSIEEAMREA